MMAAVALPLQLVSANAAGEDARSVRQAARRWRSGEALRVDRRSRQANASGACAVPPVLAAVASIDSRRGPAQPALRPRGVRAAASAADAAAGSAEQAPAASGGKIVAVAGGTGLVGSRLVERLLERGYQVRVLTRSKSRAASALTAVTAKAGGVSFAAPSEWAGAVSGVAAVVNLAGAPISTRWSDEIKAEIRSSRINTTRALVDAITALPAASRPKTFVSGSAVGFYGVSETSSFDEASSAGADFLAQLCIDWEAEARKVPDDVRLVIVRTGIVLEKSGGALGKMLPIFQLFAGGPVGSGQQWFSWVHRDDLVELLVTAIENPSYSGIFNGTAPTPVRFSEFCTALGETIGRPSWLPVPGQAVELLLGEGATVVLNGQRVLPKRAQEAGFKFQYDNVRRALSSLLK